MPTSVTTGAPGALNPTRQQLDELEALLKRMLELPVNKTDDANEAEGEDPPDEAPAAPPAMSSRKEVAARAAETRPAAPAVSYMVVETASPRPLPPASGFEPSGLVPRLMPLTPLEPTEEKPAAPEVSEEETPEAPSAEAPAEASAEEMPAAEKPAGEEWVPLRSTWKPSAQTWQPLAESWHQANTAPAPSAAVPTPPLDPPSPPEVTQPPALDEVARALQPSAPSIDETPVPPAPAPVPATEPHLRLTEDDAPAPLPKVLLPLVWFNQGFDACLAPLGATGRRLCSPGGRRFLGIVGLLSLAAAVAVAASAGMGWTW